MTQVTINFGTTVTYGEGREPDSDDSWDRGDTVQYVSFNSAHLGSCPYPSESYYAESDETFALGDPIYAVIVVYSDGDTFGHNEGYVCVALVTHDADKAHAWTPDKGDANGYKPWNSYFGGLTDYRVESFVLQP